MEIMSSLAPGPDFDLRDGIARWETEGGRISLEATVVFDSSASNRDNFGRAGPGIGWNHRQQTSGIRPVTRDPEP